MRCTIVGESNGGTGGLYVPVCTGEGLRDFSHFFRSLQIDPEQALEAPPCTDREGAVKTFYRVTQTPLETI
jgi:hypothetical protein